MAPALPAGGRGWLVILALSALVARNGEVGSSERSVFRAVNDLPEWLYRPLWIFQQFGNLLVAAIIGVVVLLALRRHRLALAVPVGVALKLLGERVVKQIVERARPESTIGDAHLRGNVPTHGLSFVSGHAVIAATIAMVLTAALPRRWRPVPWIVAGLNSFVRCSAAGPWASPSTAPCVSPTTRAFLGKQTVA